MMIPADTDLLLHYVQNNDLNSLKQLITTRQKEKSTKQNIKSYLMLSAHNVKHLQKIDTLDADAVMLNLEDGVSKELKPVALYLAMLAVQNASKQSYIVVRVNPLDEGGIDEIKALNTVKPDAIRVPKIYSQHDVHRVLQTVSSDIDVHLSIETKEAFNTVQSLRIDERISVFYLGILDLYADMGLAQSSIVLDNPFTQYILSKFLYDCKCCGVSAVGFTFQNHLDLDTFSKWCAVEKLMGYEAKSCISPKQVAIANRVFGDDEEISRATEIIRLFEANKKRGITGFDTSAYGFVDEPIYKDALNTLKKHT
jgi:citrate lyase subunit beta/citryl-CoA lyase